MVGQLEYSDPLAEVGIAEHVVGRISLAPAALRGAALRREPHRGIICEPSDTDDPLGVDNRVDLCSALH